MSFKFKVRTVNVPDYVHEISNMETSINILTTKAFIGYPLDLAQRVREVGIASACRRQAFVRAALVAQARVIWQGSRRVDLGSCFGAVEEELVAFHASV